MASTEPNQPTPEPERPRSEAQLDGSPGPSGDSALPDDTPSGRHRAPSTQEPESDSPWGLSPVGAVDVLPGEPPVRVSHTWAHSPADPPTGQAEVFTGLTPRVAAMMIVTYTRPGDIVIDTTADLAVEGTATAGSRQYHRRTSTPDPTSEREPSPSGARLVVLSWPTEPSPAGGGDATRQLSGGSDLESALVAARRLAAPDAHLVVVSDPASPGGYRDRARTLIQAVRATGGGRLRHVVLVGRSPLADARGAHGASPGLAAGRLDLIVFVVSLRVGGHHG